VIRYLSKMPLAFTHSDPFYAMLSKVLLEKASSVTPRPFGFSAAYGTAQESTRFIVPVARVFEDQAVAEGVRTWISRTFAGFLGALRREVVDASYTLHDAARLRFQLRFRLLQDRRGYALAPHKDSRDTLFAFLLQLDPQNPTTSIFLKSGDGYLFKDAGVDGDEDSLRLFLTVYLEKLCRRPVVFQLTPNQFGSGYVAWADDGVAWTAVVSENTLVLHKFDQVRLRVPALQLLALHNPGGSIAFRSDRSAYVQASCSHGFFPADFDIRNVFLADLLCGFTDANALAIPKDSDPELEHYVLFSKESTMQLLKASGLVS